jgi:REP element-mobilizing transposase RayT
MARALRVEYPGARYHLMGRGNQSRDIFEHQEDADLFIRTLGEMCVRNQTVVHAWCLMSNHYHLLLETPLGNLVDAMKWFQGTFTQRYNARHQLWGHLFQGRYKAKIIDDEDDSYFRKVSEYVHLNPADAGLVKVGGLADYPWSSYPLYLKPPSQRPDWLTVLAVMNACGMPDDSLKSRRAYAAYMDLRHQSLVMKTQDVADQAAWKHMERGWVHGSKEFRDRLRNCLLEQGRHPEELEQKRDVSEAAAGEVLNQCLDFFKLDCRELPRLAKSDPRKFLIAGLLRYHYPVRAQWVSEQLGMGHFTTVSRAMRFYDEAEGVWATAKQQILKFIG